MELADTAWLAGLLEGEGSFSCRTPARQPSSRTLIIQLNMTDKDVVEHAAELMAAPSIHNRKTKGNRKPSYLIVVSGYKAEKIMETILPFMGKRRRDKIISALSEWRNRSIALRPRGRKPDCHPDRPHKGNGLCDECHRRKRYIDKDIPRRLAVRSARDRDRDILWVSSSRFAI
jgi:hypothetical protein